MEAFDSRGVARQIRETFHKRPPPGVWGSRDNQCITSGWLLHAAHNCRDRRPFILRLTEESVELPLEWMCCYSLDRLHFQGLQML